MSRIRLIKRISIASIIIAVILGVGGWLFWYLSQPIVPSAIRSKLPFSPLVYVGAEYKVSSYKYASEEKIFSYVIKDDSGNYITVAEQVQPPQFTDIPEYKDRFLDNVTRRYATVQSSGITVYLTRPPKQAKQVGIIIDKGLLVFMSANKDLNEDQWRKIADHLELERL